MPREAGMEHKNDFASETVSRRLRVVYITTKEGERFPVFVLTVAQEELPEGIEFIFQDEVLCDMNAQWVN